MWYHEYALTPETRSGVLVPRSALAGIYNRPDSGYCSVYGFDEAARWAIKAQGDSKGLGRFAVYSDRLWIDIDAADSTETEVARVKALAQSLTIKFKAAGYTFSTWFSGSKGYHICIRIAPMHGRDVPYSQLVFVRDVLKIECDYSLYQHARLLSNPGRLHPKTGVKKHKVFEHSGGVLLEVPLIAAPERQELTSESLTDSDLARIGFHRLTSFIQDTPLPGMRHTKLWSLASALFEAGMSRDLVSGQLLYVNKFLPDPKPDSEVLRAVEQAANQLGVP